MCLRDYPRLYRSEKIVQTQVTPTDVGDLARHHEQDSLFYPILYVQRLRISPNVRILAANRHTSVKYKKRIACKKLLVWYQEAELRRKRKQAFCRIADATTMKNFT